MVSIREAWTHFVEMRNTTKVMNEAENSGISPEDIIGR
jgi:hypothetical protein